VGVSSRYSSESLPSESLSSERGLERVLTVTVSSSVEIIFPFAREFCREVAVAQVLSVLSEGVVSDKRLRALGLLSVNLDLRISGDWYRRGRENYNQQLR
jgi:hypothetical protein